MGTSGDGARAEAGGFPARGRDGWMEGREDPGVTRNPLKPAQSELPKPGINIPLPKGKGSLGD